eukprot:6295863-Pyramimonas_sp.AAC.1
MKPWCHFERKGALIPLSMPYQSKGTPHARRVVPAARTHAARLEPIAGDQRAYSRDRNQSQ